MTASLNGSAEMPFTSQDFLEFEALEMASLFNRRMAECQAILERLAVLLGKMQDREATARIVQSLEWSASGLPERRITLDD